jgi:hypothetical protein
MKVASSPGTASAAAAHNRYTYFTASVTLP